MLLDILNSSRSVSLVRLGAGTLITLAPVMGWAQELTPVPSAEPKRVVSVIPRLSITETFSNNASLSSVGKQSEQITEISPGIQIASDRGRIKGFLDYSLRQAIYAQNTSGRISQNALNTFGTVEAFENFAYLDFNGNIAQQAISAFGAQSPSNLSTNANSTESRTFRLSPYLRGKLSSVAEYEARYSLTSNRSDSLLGSNVNSNEGLLRIKGQSSAARLGWSLDANRQNIRYTSGRTTEADTLSGNLTYSVNSQLNLSAFGGKETNNYTTFNKSSSFISGFGVNWIPSEATKVSASRQNRSYGSSHSIFFEHRTARTAWRFNDSRDVSATPSQTGLENRGSVYDLLFAQAASSEPDPVLRAALVDETLRVNGLNPNATVVSSFLTSALSLQRRQDLSFVLLGIRDTVTLTASRSEGYRLDTIVGTVNDDLSNFAVVRQRGLSLNLAHRLTPEATLNVVGSVQRASDSQGLQNTSTKSLNVSVSTRVGPQTTAVLGARRVVFESPTVPYTESAVSGTLNVQF
jgi:uncharacterized protein (PEP-CTERM system associated)